MATNNNQADFILKNGVLVRNTSSSKGNNVLTNRQQIAPTLSNKGVVQITAPVKSTSKKKKEEEEEEEQKRTWFTKGSFDDGYQFGDVTKSILGTVTDVGENLATGVLRMGETTVDSLASLSAGQYLYQQSQYGQFTPEVLDTANKIQKDSEEFIKKDLYNEEEIAKRILTQNVEGLTGIDVERSSILGEKSDSLVQSAGQLGATVGLSAVGVPWYLTTGLTSFGGEMESALNQGATYGEALGSSLISAGAEVLTEKLSGGISFGGGTLDDVIMDRLTKKISSKTIEKLAKNKIVNIAGDMIGEGTEEVITSVISNLGTALYKEENLSELLMSEEAVDEYIESFIGGAVLGGGSSAISTISDSRKAKKNAYTENETQVINAEVENRIKEAEADGTTLDNKAKKEIERQVKAELEKGEISIDSIERTIGSESYTEYDNLVKESEEFEKLRNTTGAEMTDVMTDRLNELKAKNSEKSYQDMIAEAKQKIADDVRTRTVNDRFLQESYNEKAKRSEVFQADLTKYDTKQQAVIQKAVDSGILNNTRKTHEFVDMVAKISADKGVSFDFTNNEKLSKSKFALEGKTINGFVENGNVTLNIDSNKALNTVVGHEIVHVMEGTELYTELQNAIKEYATMKGDYTARVDSVKKRYEGVEGAVIENEVTADLIGDYLFTDSDFVSKLSAEKPNLFKKIYEEIKYLVKVATGSKEAKQLAKVKKAFDKAYKEASNKDTGTRYALGDENIKVEVNDFHSGEMFATMSYTQDGKVVGTLEYSEYEGKPNVKMIEVSPEYRRNGIGKKLLQELQRKYPDTEINFGMSTPDGSKLIENSTYTVEDKELAEKFARLEYAEKKIEEYDEGYNNYYENDLDIPENYAEDYNDLLDEIYQLKNELRGKKKSKRLVKMDNSNIRYSMGEGGKKFGDYNVYGSDIALETSEEIAPTGQEVAPIEETVQTTEVIQEDDYAPMTEEKANRFVESEEEWERMRTLQEVDEPTEVEEPIYNNLEANDPFENRDIKEVGNRSVKAYMYENPEVKPYFQEEAQIMLGELRNSIKGERVVNAQVLYDTNGEAGVWGVKRETSEELAYLLDNFKYTYAELEKGLNAIIEDNGKENNAVSKRIEFMLDERLRLGHTDFMSGYEVPPNQEYISMLVEKEVSEYSDEAWNQWLSQVAEQEATQVEEVENVAPIDDTKVLYSLELEQQNIVEEMDSIVEAEETKTEFDEINVEESYNNKLANYRTALLGYQNAKNTITQSFDETISKKEAEYSNLKRKDTNKATKLLEQIENLKLRKANNLTKIDSKIKRVEGIIEKFVNKEVQIKETMKLDQKKQILNKRFEQSKENLRKEYDQRKEEALKRLEDKGAFIRNQAKNLYTELSNIKKGVKASPQLGYLLDVTGKDWKGLKIALANVQAKPLATVNVNENSSTENWVRETLLREHERQLESANFDFDNEYETAVKELEFEHETKIKNLERFEKRQTKQKELREFVSALMGDTSKWQDKKYGIQYQTNTLKRNLRDIVRDQNGNRDIEHADRIYDELQGEYNRNEARLNNEANRIKKEFADMKLTKAENVYIQMLGEFRHNPETTVTNVELEEFYNKHKKHIDVAKVDKAIERARELYDSLYEKVNESLKEHGFTEIGYKKGYFPHFTEEKQSILEKIFNWKTQNFEIPTDIAGLTEEFTPQRSWQSFSQHRQSDVTDYNFAKGLDNYVQGALDWIYHIEDIQKRRAFETEIRYRHSDEKVQQEIDRLRKNESLTTEELSELIETKLKEAENPLGNFLIDFRNATNNLAGKKSTEDRTMEYRFNRQVYSTMTNISNRVTANMVVGSVSASLSNLIPITQSWGQVSPISSLRAMGDTIKSTIKDDGTIAKSTFLTNRLARSENLYKTNWDKVTEKVAFMMNVIDSFTSQTVWRSKYMENIQNGMSENEAIRNADQFAENVIAGRSRGNMPTIFNAKNPLAKVFTAFQLEVANQYGYMFKDMPQDTKNEGTGKLVKGYATMFMGAYVYNELMNAIMGRDVAFDPIGIIQEFLTDLFGDDDEEEDVLGALGGLAENVTKNIPFVGGLMGGGRVPLSSALPYENPVDMVASTVTDIAEGDWGTVIDEWTNPLYYVALPVGGGQLRKTVQGLSMFNDDHPVSGSYTQSGNLRFSVEDTFLKRLQAGVFGQYSSEEARQYFDEGRNPLKEKQIQELADLDMPIKEYWEYRDGLKEQSTLEEKFDYIAGLDLPVKSKNIMINNIVDRKEEVDMSNYDDFGSYEEFDFYTKNTEKYNFLDENGISYSEYKSSKEAKEEYDSLYEWYNNYPEKVSYAKAITDNLVEYKRMTKTIDEIEADKDSKGNSISGSRKTKVINYVNSLELSVPQKAMLIRKSYSSFREYNNQIVEYVSGLDISYEEKISILSELEMQVDSNGNVTWK